MLILMLPYLLRPKLTSFSTNLYLNNDYKKVFLANQSI
ncbi:hypothetical protein BVAVS116_K0014 (plasmid) [Borreliella valaisiana VS116]|uniref:Uncharacterized protein n=1 Tax=Borreliella valaisiana VS116 TaxID=445987 RepID=C0R8K7_BORVA|nr:hypothetical protein BVAVS116_K0014 [Borreliella valaisiana VS116]